MSLVGQRMKGGVSAIVRFSPGGAVNACYHLILRLSWRLRRCLHRGLPPWPQFLESRKTRQAARRGYDLMWARYALCAATLGMAANVFAFVPCPVVTKVFASFPEVFWVAVAANVLFGVLMLPYFGHLLCRRLHCPLMEWCLIVVTLGFMESLVLTTSGVLRSAQLATLLASSIAGWILWGGVKGLVEARLLNVQRVLPCVGLIVAAWWAIGIPALLFGGAFLAVSPYVETLRPWVGPGLAWWGLPLICAGLVGWILAGRLHAVTNRAAKELLGEA